MIRAAAVMNLYRISTPRSFLSSSHADTILGNRMNKDPGINSPESSRAW